MLNERVIEKILNYLKNAVTLLTLIHQCQKIHVPHIYPSIKNLYFVAIVTDYEYGSMAVFVNNVISFGSFPAHTRFLVTPTNVDYYVHNLITKLKKCLALKCITYISILETSKNWQSAIKIGITKHIKRFYIFL